MQIPKSHCGGVGVLSRKAISTAADVKKRLESAISKVSVVVDIWSAHSSSYIGVTAHFIDARSKLVVSFLGVREMEGVKTAECVREAVCAILADFGLSDNDVGFYITDNGKSTVRESPERSV